MTVVYEMCDNISDSKSKLGLCRQIQRQGYYRIKRKCTVAETEIGYFANFNYFGVYKA